MLGKALSLAAAGNAAVEYEISRSLRFNSGDTAYLSRTPASAGNRKTWTWSGWVKRTGLSSWGYLIDTDSTNGQNYIHIDATSGQLRFYTSNGAKILLSTSVYRDPSSWYHIVGVVDTTQATESDRVKLYVNGVRITSFATEQYPAQNADLAINSVQAHNIGRRASDRYFDGYMADIHFVDGQALTPSDFGETDETTGVWRPKAYDGTYGTNGFHLPFSDNTSTTTLGYDTSGNGNNWTANNFSVAAGVNNDSLVDTPTPYGDDTGVGGEVRGNYCTWNPLLKRDSGTLSNGNLTYVSGTSGVAGVRTNFELSPGKWYCEIQVTNNGTNSYIGVRFGSSLLQTATGNIVLGIAIDVDAGSVTFYRNNVSQGTTTGLTAGADGIFIFVNTNSYGSGAVTYHANFGQRPFTYTAPSGFKAICTTNLPTPIIADGSEYFNTLLWTGDGNTSRSFTGLSFSPDVVWVKSRSQAYGHRLYDAVRGTGDSAELSTDGAGAEGSTNSSSYDWLSSFDSNGFSSTGTGSDAYFNLNSATYAAWNWNAGGSNATNTDGTITSTVRANPTAGFSIVSYTGTGVSATVGHGLGVAPNLIILKRRDATSSSLGWIVFSYLNGVLNYGRLDGTNAFLSAGEDDPTSSVFSVLTNADINTNTGTYIAYCFANVEGYSKFGSYTGNGSADGPFVYCGFRPAFIIIKQTNTSGQNWYMYDTKRNTYNVMNNTLYPNLSLAETVGNINTTNDFLSNGFKLRDAYTGSNDSGGTYIFAAFAENPFKYSLAR